MRRRQRVAQDEAGEEGTRPLWEQELHPKSSSGDCWSSTDPQNFP